MMKKLLSLVVAALLTVSAVATSASAAKFTDVDATNDALNEAVELLVALNVTTGTSDTTYGTTENVTRAQMATFIYRMMKAGKHAPTGGANTTKFTDLDDPFYNFTIAWANDTGVIKGRNETTFDPKGGIILQDAYTMIVRALGHDDGTLSYPIGYITKAEELGLDEDLDAKVNYDTTLTRGDVAILLANMFYAETSDSYIKYEAIGGNLSNGFTPVEYFYTVAEKVFDLQKTSMKVIATPNYTFGGAERPDADVEMITLTTTGVDDYDDYADAVQNLGTYTFEFEELGLDGKADDYILSDILMFVKLDKDDSSKIEKIFGATSQGVKKTVAFDAIEFGTVSGTTADKYYDVDKEYKMIDGMLTIDGVKTYFYDAPYSYSKDSQAPNKYNIEFITLGAYDGTADDGEKFINYVIDDNAPALEVCVDQNCQTQNCADTTHFGFNHDEWVYNTQAPTYLGNIYFGGLGEVDVIDSNGDGKYDYFFKKEYSVVKVDAEEEEYLYGSQLDLTQTSLDNRTVYTDWSIVEGATFADKDVILAYVNENANYIKVAEVLKATKTEVTSIDDGEYTEFASGEKVYIKKIPFVTATAGADFGSQNANVESFGNKTIYTTADGAVVRVAGTTAGNIAYNTNWVIVLDGATSSSTQLVDGVLESADYVKVIHDGAIKSIKAKEYAQGYKCSICENANNCTHVPATNDQNEFAEYVNKLSTAKADAKGRYYFEIKVAADANFNNMADTDDATLQAFGVATNNQTTTFFNKTANIFELGDAKTTIGGAFRGVYVKEDTQIIIRHADKDGDEVVSVFGYDNLPDIAEDTIFANFSYVLQNNPGVTTYENLVVFYGEVVDSQGNLEELEGAKGDVAEIRIVVKAPSKKVVEDEDVYTYTLYNPFTGKVETAEGYSNDSYFSQGDIVALTQNGYVDDEVNAYGSIANSGAWYNASKSITNNVNANLGYIEIEEYDATSKVLALDNESAMFLTTDETVVFFVDISSGTGSLKTLTAADLASKKADYREGDDKTVDMKAFVCAEEVDNFDDQDPIYNVTFAMIVRS